MRYWEKLEQRFHHDGVESLTHKLTIADGEKQHDIYLKVGWWRGRPVWVDLTMARHSEDGNGDTLDVHESALVLVVNLRQRILDNTRAFMEVACREASLLLSSRRCRLDDIADLWRVTETEPRGQCVQVQDDLGATVHGPLDAAAKLFRIKGKEWEKRMAHNYAEDEIESMISDCEAALEERPDDFTGWERTFIEDATEQNETRHLSNGQIEKLEQIWEERDCGRTNTT